MDEVLALLQEIRAEIISLKTEMVLLKYGVEQSERMLEEMKAQRTPQDPMDRIIERL